MAQKALFPGSFDPIHTGHVYVIKRALNLFEEVVVAIGHNANKESMFSLEQRQQWLQDVFEHKAGVIIETYQGLTVDFCRKVDAQFIVRGLRSVADFQYEQAIAQMNRAMYPDIETVFLLTSPELSAINSTIIRDVIRHGGDASMFVPEEVQFK